jgi:DNA-binding NtrC family response regulator
VGSDKDSTVDVRVIAATNKNLKHEIEKGAFREDLYHRLSVIIIDVPPLAERKEDIPLLAEHFIAQIGNESGINKPKLTPAAIAALQKQPWTGNIREFRNVIERLMILSGKTITDKEVTLYSNPVK